MDINDIDKSISRLWWDINKYTTENDRKYGRVRELINSILILYANYLKNPDEIVDGRHIVELLNEKIDEGNAAIALVILSESK